MKVTACKSYLDSFEEENGRISHSQDWTVSIDILLALGDKHKFV